ncbi:hypothetical protein DEGR_06090 [Deinococcus grandis]|nr:hypothetical protein DEGR_06090 [Deinococcus grandis]
MGAAHLWGAADAAVEAALLRAAGALAPTLIMSRQQHEPVVGSAGEVVHYSLLQL